MKPSVNKTSPARAPRRKRTRGRGSTSILDLVRAGVERFVLKDANMMSFLNTVHTAAKKGKNSTHPLTGAAFRRIVREAVRKRKMRIGRPTSKHSKSGGRTPS